LRLLDCRFEKALLDAVQRCSFLDQIAFLKQEFLEIALHPCGDVNAAYRLDAADVIKHL
jgi:hypothetical protein